MNKKKFKKLALTSETLRNLNDTALQEAVGATVAQTNCLRCDPTFGTAACSECTARCSICCA